MGRLPIAPYGCIKKASQYSGEGLIQRLTIGKSTESGCGVPSHKCDIYHYNLLQPKAQRTSQMSIE